MPQDLKIERYDVIAVQTVEKNQYGDLVVNGSIKIGNKRSYLFDAFQPGAEVKVGYSIYMNREYIATAEQTGEHRPTAETTPLVKEAVKMGAEVIGSTDDTKLRSVVIAYAKDLAVAGKIELKDMGRYANGFLDYILNIKRKGD